MCEIFLGNIRKNRAQVLCTNFHSKMIANTTGVEMPALFISALNDNTKDFPLKILAGLNCTVCCIAIIGGYCIPK